MMIICAHPDDAEGFAGGIVSQATKSYNISVAYLVLTSGNAGGQCYDSEGAYFECSKEDIAVTRKNELLKAANFLGVEKVFRMVLDDGLLVSYDETRIRRALTAYIRSYRPHIVLTHYPEPNFEASPTCNGLCEAPNNWDDLGYHPDHKQVGWHTFHAVYGGGSSVDNDSLFHDLAVVGLPKWKVEELYFFALTKSQPITHYFELSEASLHVKAQACGLHKSQYPSPPINNTRWVAESVGRAVGVGLAEGFQGFF